MPIRWKFLIYTILGSALYNVAHVGLGWALGSQWTLVERYEPIVKYAVLAALAGGIIWFVWRRWKERG
jgi:membrane protein DedA with SNARE-associated domain